MVHIQSISFPSKFVNLRIDFIENFPPKIEAGAKPKLKLFLEGCEFF